MNLHLLIGAAMVASGSGLIYIALPDKNQQSPRFMQFSASTVLYPPVVLMLIAGGIAELISGFM